MAIGKRQSTAAKTSGGNKFQYRQRTAEEMYKRAHQSGGSREGFARPDINTFTPIDGENKIRILPPTWDDADHYGIELYVHYGIGADNNAYVCLQKHGGKSCPVCEARQQLDKAGDDEGAKELLPKKRVAMWIINRKEEAKGPLVWFAPWTLDMEIAKQAIDEDQVTLPLDSPYEGYDITFERTPGGKNVPPKYSGVKVARKASTIFDTEAETDAVLEYVKENPIPDCIVYHDYETISAAFNGTSKGPKVNGAASETAETEGGKPKPKWGRAAAKPADPEPEPPDVQVGVVEDPSGELPTWAEVHEMDEDVATSFANDAGLDYENEEFEDLAAFQDWLCTQLEIEAPKPAGKPKPTFGGGKPKIGAKPTPAAAPAAGQHKPTPASSGWKSKLEKLRASK